MSSAALPSRSPPPSLAAELLELLRRPTRTYPLLFERGRSGAVLVFSAVSGIYVAYVTAQGFGLGDRIGFAGAALAVLLVGAVWGLVALYFAGGLLSWSAETLRGDTETERMYAVFGYATWPFLPLLAVIVPLEFAAYDTTLFAEERPEASALLVWGVNALELATIGLWLLLMVKGTALAARLSQVAAAETVVLSLVEMSVIAVLLLVILVVSFMI